jgi:DtxR family Mn-dependent transcriptional regulator
MEASASVEDYLKTVWKLSSAPRTAPPVSLGAAAGSPVPPSELARALGVSAPSVSAMIRRLRSAGLLVAAPAGAPVELSADGERTALSVVRRHRLLETFLVEVLGLGWDEVHAEAEILEHALTPRVERAIADHLGQPVRDPHGDPIPPPPGGRGDAWHREEWGQPLAAAGGVGDFVVERVEDSDPAVLRHLADLDVVPGVRLHLDGIDEHGGPLWVRVCAPAGDSGRQPLGSGLVARVHGRGVPAGHRPADRVVAVDAADTVGAGGRG